MENRLYRDEHHKTIGGVCAGLADYFSIDVSLVRVVFVLSLVMHGCGLLLYIILWSVIPKKKYVTASAGIFMEPEPASPAPIAYSTGRMISGIVFIMLGAFFLLDQYGIIPEFDFNKFWPVILIVIGLVFIFGFWKQKPEQPEEKTATFTENDNTTDNTQNI